jgi:hypothetical protein
MPADPGTGGLILKTRYSGRQNNTCLKKLFLKYDNPGLDPDSPTCPYRRTKGDPHVH